jgi:antitoxin HigA-1
MPPKNQMRPIHPGEVLLEDYLKPLGMSASALAAIIGVPPNRVTAIVAGKRAVTADTALRLARAFDSSPEFWMNMQQGYDLRVAELAAGPAVKAIRVGSGLRKAC